MTGMSSVRARRPVPDSRGVSRPTTPDRASCNGDVMANCNVLGRGAIVRAGDPAPKGAEERGTARYSCYRPPMLGMFPFLLLAAVLEIGGDAAMRYGLLRSARSWLLVGSMMLVAYGFAVNTNSSVDFGRLMGLYIALFFLVSQLVGWIGFGERPSAALIVGGTLIVAGGLVIQGGTP